MKTLIYFILGTVVGGGAMVYFRPTPENRETMVSGSAGKPSVPVARSAGALTLAEDNESPVPEQVIEQLEQRLAVRDREVSTLRAAIQSAVVVPDVIRDAGEEDRQGWLDSLRTDDPERYQELMERREAARQLAQYELAKRAAHFLFREDELLTDDERSQHERMMALLQQSFELTEKIRVDMPEEERRDMLRTIRQNMRELSPLLENERDRELYRLGKDIGYTDDDAAAFALYIRDVIDMTSVRSMFRGAMRELGGWGGSWGGGWGGRDESR
jgi:hypothetical protein